MKSVADNEGGRDVAVILAKGVPVAFVSFRLADQDGVTFTKFQLKIRFRN